MPNTLILFFRSLLVLNILVTVAWAQGVKKATGTAKAEKTSVATVDDLRSFVIPEHFFGFNSQMMRGPSWRDEGFVQQVRKLSPEIIRYPGGTNSSYWDWKTGWLMDGIELKKDYKSIRKNPITLSDLKFACDSTGAVPLFVLNMVNSNLEYQLQMLRSAKSIGLPVLYVELDNEVYLGESVYVNRFPTGVDYAKECNKWISAIKKEFSGVKVSVVAFSTRESAARKAKDHKSRSLMWNRDLISNIKNADAMSFHLYGGNGLNFLAGRMNDDGDNGDEGAAEELQQYFEKENAVSILLGVPFSRWKNSVAYDIGILPKNMKAWYTEYNMFEREGVVAGTWAHGLYAVTQTLLFPENDKSGLLCFHNLTTSAQFAALFNTPTGFHKAVKQKPTKQFGFTASGYGLWLTAKAFKNGAEAKKISFSNNSLLQGARGQEYPALTGWVVQHGGKKKIIVVNLAPHHVITDFKTIVKAGATYTQIESDPRTQVATQDDVAIRKGTGTSLSLFPYSVTLIEGE